MVPSYITFWTLGQLHFSLNSNRHFMCFLNRMEQNVNFLDFQCTSILVKGDSQSQNIQWSLFSRMFDNYLKMKIFFSNNWLVGCIVRGLVGILCRLYTMYIGILRRSWSYSATLSADSDNCISSYSHKNLKIALSCVWEAFSWRSDSF